MPNWTRPLRTFRPSDTVTLRGVWCFLPIGTTLPMRFMTIIEPGRWSIWLADVVFDDDPTSYKRRPVLILGRKGTIFVSFKITSTLPRNKWDYTPLNWFGCGLDHESTVRLSRKIYLAQTDLIHPLGILPEPDRSIIDDLISRKHGKGLVELYNKKDRHIRSIRKSTYIARKWHFPFFEHWH